MLRSEVIADGRTRFWSDRGMKIRQIETGILYEDAINNAPYTYEETDIPIEPDEPNAEDKAEAYDILVGNAV